MNRLLTRMLLTGMVGTASLTAMGTVVTTGSLPVAVEMEKITTWIGDGDARAALVMRWNDGKGIDNIAVGVKFDPSESVTPESLVEKVYAGDWRFYKTADNTGLCFDLNGDKIYDNAENTAYDHSADDGDGGEWNIISSTAGVTDGTVVYAEYVAEGETRVTDTGYLFYLPQADETGVWFPEKYTVHLADEKPVVPIYINLDGGTLVSLSSKFSDTSVGSIALSNTTAAKKGQMLAAITLKGTMGEFNVTSSITMKKPGETKSTTTAAHTSTIVVAEPEVKFTTLAPKEDPIVVRPSTRYPILDLLDYGPEKPTYLASLTVEKLNSATQAYYDTRKFELSTGAVGGRQPIRVTDKLTGLSTEFTVSIEAENKVTAIKFRDEEVVETGMDLIFDPYKIEYNSSPIFMEVEPADADIPTLKFVIDESSVDGKVSFTTRVPDYDNKFVLIGYKDVPGEHEIVEVQYQKNTVSYEIYSYAAGTVTGHFESTDGGDARSEQVTMRIREHSLDVEDFSDGTFWLNEEWFGHANGSINYIDPDRNVHYRVYNAANYNESAPRDNRTFGCTSQYGMIFGDRLYVMSKQAHDTGDCYYSGGGRLVIADANTLKRLHSFDELGEDGLGDGRACVGVSADKVYIGTHRSIRVLNINNEATTPEEMFTLGKELVYGNVGGDTTPGSSSGSLYSNQIGDMICAGGYVFAVQQDHGILVIDTETDEYVTTLGNKYAQAIAQSADGNLWYALNDTDKKVVSLHCVNPETLEETESVDLPESAGTVNTGWGAWRSANFFASREQNVLFWGNVGSGYQDDILGKGTGCIYRWEIGTELPTKPFFELGQRPGMNETTFQSPYATMRYDDRNDVILMATTHGASYNYRYEWLYFINGTTGEIEEIKDLKRYFWFPAMPIFPDKHAPQINLESITTSLEEGAVDIDLAQFITDADNIDYNIKVSIVDQPMPMDADEMDQPANYELVGKTLTVTPLSGGNHSVMLRVESNGKVVDKEIPVKVGSTTGIAQGVVTRGTVAVDGKVITVSGYDGYDFAVYGMDGSLVTRFTATGATTTAEIDVPGGVYVLRGRDRHDSFTTKLVVR